MKYEFIDHTADIMFKAYGKDLEGSFSNAAIAMTKSFCEEKVKGNLKKEISVEGNDLENLLYNFLEELLVLFDSEHFILSKIVEIKIDSMKFKLSAKVVGDIAESYEIYSHIKAVTYNNMFVREEEEGRWVSQVVLDV